MVEMKIYLAGKIEQNCWRHQYVDGLEHAGYSPDSIPDAIRGVHSYSGPFFENPGHGMSHGERTHGVVQKEYAKHWQEEVDRVRVAVRCLFEIDRADVVIAKLAPDAHGTLVEVGYAIAKGKRVLVIDESNNECWFAVANAEPVDSVDDALDICDKLQLMEDMVSRTESIAEERFAEACALNGLSLLAQYPACGYRLDFARPDLLLAIEIDGIDFHGSQEAFVTDRKRTRVLEAAGWKVVRFAAKEVLDPETARQCVIEVRKLMGVMWNNNELHRKSGE